jgi:hypothetical protein
VKLVADFERCWSAAAREDAVWTARLFRARFEHGRQAVAVDAPYGERGQ